MAGMFTLLAFAAVAVVAISSIVSIAVAERSDTRGGYYVAAFLFSFIPLTTSFYWFMK